MRPFQRPTLHEGLLWLFSSACALLFFNAKGTDDVTVWLRWIFEIEKRGLVGGYASVAPDYPYPPLSFVLLDVAARGAHFLGISERTGIKVSLLLFLLLTAAVFYACTRNLLLTTLLQFALILSSVDLAYLDIYFAPPLILALWALQRRRWAIFAVCFTLTCLIKWQPLLLTPFFLLYIAGSDSGPNWRAAPWRRWAATVVLPALLVVGATLAVFGTAVLAAFQHALRFPVLSAQALNANWLLSYALEVTDPARYGPLVNGQVSLITLPENAVELLLPKLVLAAFYLGILILAGRAPKTFPNLLHYATVGYLAYCLFNTGVHENHWFPVVVLLAYLSSVEATALPWFLTWAAVANANLFVFYGVDGRALPFNRVMWTLDTSLPLALLNVLLFGCQLAGPRTSPAPPPHAAKTPEKQSAANLAADG